MATFEPGPLTEEEKRWANLSPQQMQQEIHRVAREKGWWDDKDRAAGEIYMNIAAEVSEGWEDWRKHGKTVFYEEGHPLGPEAGPNKPEGGAIELADAVIRIMDYLEHEDFDLWELIARKMAYNTRREHRHGGKHA